MLFEVDTAAKAPLYEQIVVGIRRAISDGELTVGDRLPPARRLAESLDVNMHTVLKAYGTLRDEGILEMRRGRGVTVAAVAAKTNRLRELAGQLAAEAKNHGLGRKEVLRLVEEYLQ
ncbi:MAG: GntR family transcriptional regulator [Acidimicrobiales bacterium]